MPLNIFAIPSTSPATILFGLRNKLYASAYKNNPNDRVAYFFIPFTIFSFILPLPLDMLQ